MYQATRWIAAGLALTALTGVAQANSAKKKAEAEFLLLLKILPGEYDNLTQTDAEGDTHEHAAILLSIKPIDAMTVGKLVMYVHETAADDPRRMLSQRIWVVARDKEGVIIQRVFMFKEPQRWLHASDDPLLLRSLLPDDLTPMSGCELTWSKTATGFAASIKPHGCRPASASEGQLVETSAELTEDDLTLIELQAGTGGRLAADIGSASVYHFQRRGG